MSVSIFIGSGSEDDLNVSNENFCRIMALLDVDIDLDSLAGSFEGQALLNLQHKVLLALDVLRMVPALDGAIGYHRHESGGAVLIECGISDGYFSDRLPRLLAVIEAAIGAGEPVRYA